MSDVQFTLPGVRNGCSPRRISYSPKIAPEGIVMERLESPVKPIRAVRRKRDAWSELRKNIRIGRQQNLSLQEVCNELQDQTHPAYGDQFAGLAFGVVAAILADSTVQAMGWPGLSSLAAKVFLSSGGAEAAGKAFTTIVVVQFLLFVFSMSLLARGSWYEPMRRMIDEAFPRWLGGTRGAADAFGRVAAGPILAAAASAVGSLVLLGGAQPLPLVVAGGAILLASVLGSIGWLAVSALARRILSDSPGTGVPVLLAGVCVAALSVFQDHSLPLPATLLQRFQLIEYLVGLATLAGLATLGLRGLAGRRTLFVTINRGEPNSPLDRQPVVNLPSLVGLGRPSCPIAMDGVDYLELAWCLDTSDLEADERVFIVAPRTVIDAAATHQIKVWNFTALRGLPPITMTDGQSIEVVYAVPDAVAMGKHFSAGLSAGAVAWVETHILSPETFQSVLRISVSNALTTASNKLTDAIDAGERELDLARSELDRFRSERLRSTDLQNGNFLGLLGHELEGLTATLAKMERKQLTADYRHSAEGRQKIWDSEFRTAISREIRDSSRAGLDRSGDVDSDRRVTQEAIELFASIIATPRLALRVSEELAQRAAALQSKWTSLQQEFCGTLKDIMEKIRQEKKRLQQLAEAGADKSLDRNERLADRLLEVISSFVQSPYQKHGAATVESLSRLLAQLDFPLSGEPPRPIDRKPAEVESATGPAGESFPD